MISRTLTAFNESLNNQAIRDKIPLTGQFELTARCNLHCKMCYVCRPANDTRALAKEISAAQWISLAKEATNAGMLYVLLTGGEVFVRPDFKEIYEEMLNLGLRITIYTNATLISPEIAKWLGRIPPSCVGVTIYGASAQTYKKVTGDANAFKATLQGIDLLLAEGINLELRTTVINDNANDLDQLIRIAESRNTFLKYGLYISPRRGVNTGLEKSIRLSPYDLAQYELRAAQAHANYIKKIKEELHLADGYIIDNGNRHHEAINTDSPFQCQAGRSEFWITWDGAMIPCGTMDEPAVKPLRDGFFNAWQDLTNLCQSIPLCNECQQCSLKNVCWTCPARLKSETGKYDVSSDYLCEWAKYRNILL